VNEAPKMIAGATGSLVAVLCNHVWLTVFVLNVGLTESMANWRPWGWPAPA
jgi:hypothetical protein